MRRWTVSGLAIRCAMPTVARERNGVAELSNKDVHRSRVKHAPPMFDTASVPSLSHRTRAAVLWNRTPHGTSSCSMSTRTYARSHDVAPMWTVCWCSTRHMYTASMWCLASSARVRGQAKQHTTKQKQQLKQKRKQGQLSLPETTPPFVHTSSTIPTPPSAEEGTKKTSISATSDTAKTSRASTLAVEQRNGTAGGEELLQAEKSERDDGEPQATKLESCFAQMAQEYSAARTKQGQPLNTRPVHQLRIGDAEVAHWCCARCRHVWQCGIFVRCMLKLPCPRCNAAAQRSIASARPDLVPLWHREDNDPFLSPHALSAESAVRVRWWCPMCHHGFDARVKDMVRGSAMCPSCTLTQTHSAGELLTRSEEGVLVQEWHPLRNGDLRLDQLSPTDKQTRVWWLCAVCGHDWQASLATRLTRSLRARGRVCPACRGRDVPSTVM